MIATLRNLGKSLSQNYREAKAGLTGKAISRARMIKALRDIDESLLRKPGTPGAPKPTHIVLRMMDGKPMVYFTDGSLRHILGRAPARKAAKKARREARRVKA